MLVGAVVNVATTAITAGVFGEEYTLKDAVMAAVTGAVGATAPSIYAQQGKCRNHAAFSTLKTIKQPL